MALPALVLVHGGGLAGDCWDLTVDEVHRQAPELRVLAVDLPGRRGNPGDLLTLTIADFVDSVVRDVNSAGLDDIVLVGHSLSGVVIPGVATKLGAARVREIVYAAAFVPAEGSSLADTVIGPLAPLARRNARRGGLSRSPAWGAKLTYLNGAPRARRRFLDGKLHPESGRVLAEKVSRKDMPTNIPRTWIMTHRDRAVPLKSQRMSIEVLGGVQTLIEIDTCHCLMVSEPTRLAEILIDRCRVYSR